MLQSPNNIDTNLNKVSSIEKLIKVYDYIKIP